MPKKLAPPDLLNILKFPIKNTDRHHRVDGRVSLPACLPIPPAGACLGTDASGRRVAKREYVNGNRQQLEWAINYLEANYQANFADNDEHGSIDWMVKTSSLDPEERVVTQHL
eukprot:SAG22_NODE_245_length_13962_cov_11.954555_7_plen_113_part_00